ncbi:Ferri-bacillibactin esterase BesA [Peribacillus sp. Bi96]|uniref:hypothetical protein n=1 Tax=unclassified Peribacillus TaxID=2675266 RepID=UPI001DC47DBB|nr:hypothetical protein [Peribacillus sp. Bi96]CAH0291144.1 Ferri-bacillibactin esterase BesA [Peribacillus sp. Bi96]
MLGVGELEGPHKSGMNENALELSKRLSLKDSGVNVQFKEFEGEGHLSVLPPLINRALRFALKRAKEHLVLTEDELFPSG